MHEIVRNIVDRRARSSFVDSLIRWKTRRLFFYGVLAAVALSEIIVATIHYTLWGGGRWGREVMVDGFVTPLLDASIILLLIAAIIVRLKDSRQELSRTKQLLEDITQGIAESILLVSKDLKILWANKAALQQTGLAMQDLVGMPCHLATHRSHSPCAPPDDPCPILDLVASGTEVVEHTHYDINGDKITVEVCAYPIRDEYGKVVSYVHITRDVTARKKAEQTLRLLSTTDELTGLANRRAFDAFLEQEWRRAIRAKSILSVLMIDVDFFKRYNDAYGHLKGDAALKSVADVLKTIARRPGDIAARFGGEEFVVVLSASEQHAIFSAERLRNAVEVLDIPHPGSAIADHLTISIGVASLIPRMDLSPVDLIKQADEALYHAKKEGRNMAVLYDPNSN